MTILIFLIYNFGIWIIGNNLIGVFQERFTRLERCGLAYLLGLYVHALLYFLIRFFLIKQNIHNSFILIFLVLATSLIKTLFKSKQTNIIKANNLNKKYQALTIITSLVFTLAFSYSLIQSIYWPPYQPDALHLYDFRAKVLLQGDAKTFLNAGPYINEAHYPPYTSLLHFFAYQNGLSNPKFIYPAMLVCFSMAIYGYMTRKSNSKFLSVLAPTLILITPSIWWNSFFALTYIPLMIYFSLAVIYATDSQSGNRFMTSSLLIAGTNWIRPESLWLVIPLIMFFKLIFSESKITKTLLAMSIPFITSSIWPKAIKRIQQTPIKRVSREIVTTVQNMNHPNIGKVMRFTWNATIDSWGVILPIFLLVSFISQISTKYKISFDRKILHIVVYLIIMLIYLGTFIFSIHQPDWIDLKTSLVRYSNIVTPLFWINIIDSTILKRTLNLNGK